MTTAVVFAGRKRATDDAAPAKVSTPTYERADDSTDSREATGKEPAEVVARELPGSVALCALELPGRIAPDVDVVLVEPRIAALDYCLGLLA